MENFVIVGIVLAAVGLGAFWTVKRLRGQGRGCCGGGGYRAKRKKLPHVLYRKIFLVDGMHCENCKNRVEEIVNDMEGISGRANLKEGKLTVSYGEEIGDELIQSRIERAGYQVTGIQMCS